MEFNDLNFRTYPCAYHHPFLLVTLYTKEVKKLILATILFSAIGILDAGYLTWEHFSTAVAPCSTSPWVDCGKVLGSEYAVIFGIPVAVLGLLYYVSMLSISVYRVWLRRNLQVNIFQFLHKRVKRWKQDEAMLLEVQLLMATAGITFSAYFVYLQLFVIKAICLYCMVSAVNSLILFGVMMYQRFMDKQQ